MCSALWVAPCHQKFHLNELVKSAKSRVTCLRDLVSVDFSDSTQDAGRVALEQASLHHSRGLVIETSLRLHRPVATVWAGSVPSARVRSSPSGPGHVCAV